MQRLYAALFLNSKRFYTEPHGLPLLPCRGPISTFILALWRWSLAPRTQRPTRMERDLNHQTTDPPLLESRLASSQTTAQKTHDASHLPLAPPPLQLLTLAQLADLLARLAVHAVCAGAAVLLEQAGGAGAALLPPPLVRVESGVRGLQREESGLMVLALDVLAERRRLGRRPAVQDQRLGLVRVHGEFISVLRGRTGSCCRHGHGHRLRAHGSNLGSVPLRKIRLKTINLKIAVLKNKHLDQEVPGLASS